MFAPFTNQTRRGSILLRTGEQGDDGDLEELRPQDDRQVADGRHWQVGKVRCRANDQVLQNPHHKPLAKGDETSLGDTSQGRTPTTRSEQAQTVSLGCPPPIKPNEVRFCYGISQFGRKSLGHPPFPSIRWALWADLHATVPAAQRLGVCARLPLRWASQTHNRQ